MDLYRWDSNMTVFLKSIGTDKAVPLLLELKWPFYFFHFAIIDFEWIRSDVYVRVYFVSNAVRGYLLDILSENSSLSWISKFMDEK